MLKNTETDDLENFLSVVEIMKFCKVNLMHAFFVIFYSSGNLDFKQFGKDLTKQVII